jgi:hypothetical protein
MSARFQPRRWQPRLGGAYVAAVKRKKSAIHQREKSSNLYRKQLVLIVPMTQQVNTYSLTHLSPSLHW